MGDTKTFLLLVVYITVCNGARNSVLAPLPTTSSTPLPTFPVMLATSRPPSPPTLEPPSSPSSECPDALDTIRPLGRLRAAMRSPIYTQNTVFDAFLVFYSDEHLSEEPSPEERRLQYISGWDGAGTGAVLAEGEAAIWVSSGDVNRARNTVSCAWLVLDADDPSQPTVAEWVADGISRTGHVNAGRLGTSRVGAGRVGADSRLTSINEWQLHFDSFQRNGLTLVHMPTLVDQLWAEEPDPTQRRPEFSRIVANLHQTEYTGLPWREKVSLLRHEIQMNGADAMIVTALDEVAWLLNVRGRDIPHAPLLKAFVLVSLKEVKVYAPQGKLSMPVREALAVYNCYNNNNCTRVLDYPNIYNDLRRAQETKIIIPTGGTFQRGASAAVAQSVSQSKRLFLPSPIIYLKAQKNEAEIKGMQKAHLRDAVAMCTLLSYLEGVMKTGLTELSVGKKVDVTRATQAGYVGVSMATRVAFGPSGADPDYRSSRETNRRLFSNSTLIIRSGGQYDEGTTVVTRTLHYGYPNKQIRAAYTTVLRSLAAMSMLQIPASLPAAHTDPVVRAPLWAAKQDYLHPTGHGVGAALNRREDPVVIDYRQDTNLHNFREGYFIMAEPGWYERNKFGIRLGNVLQVVLQSDQYLAFKEATLVPFEPKLIDKNSLTDYEIKWLNAYNERIREVVGPELKSQGLLDVYYWMSNKTVNIVPPRAALPNGGPHTTATWSLIFIIAIFFLHR